MGFIIYLNALNNQTDCYPTFNFDSASIRLWWKNEHVPFMLSREMSLPIRKQWQGRT